MEALGVGLLCVLLGVWKIYEGRSSLASLGRVWRYFRFERDENPLMFWVGVSLNFLAALGCFVLALL